MIVLGISGRRHDASAAIARHGRVVAAATEAAVIREVTAAAPAFPRGAVSACLKRSGLTVSEVDQVVVVSGHQPGVARPGRLRLGSGAGDAGPLDWRSRPCQVIDTQSADALQFGGDRDRGPRLVVVLDAHEERDGALFLTAPGSRLRLVRTIPGWGAVVREARTLSAAFGLAGGMGEALAYQASFVQHGRQPVGPSPLVTWDEALGFRVDGQRLQALLKETSAPSAEAPTAADLLHVRSLERRRELASTFLARLVELLAALVKRVRDHHGAATVGLAGSLFSNSWIASGLGMELPGVVEFSPLPDADGRAMGASLLHEFDAAGEQSLALGPEYTEQEVKTALDTARLDYVYDPDWAKLLRRVSALLVRGKTVAWFQGPMEFGPRSLGGRSVLADPSDRFARDNVLRFLKQASPDVEGLSLSLRQCDADDCLLVPVRSPHMLLRGTVLEAWRNRFRAVLDHQHSCRVHTVAEDAPSGLWELLRIHRDRWGGAGLVNATLADRGEPTACTPRDALRTFYSSAIDAMVIGRFLLMKDYWLLRSDVDR